MARAGKKPDVLDRPFDEATLVKLALFRNYIQDWLGVFTSKQSTPWPHLNILDFFAGPGADPIGTPGSPKIIIEEVCKYDQKINSMGLEVLIYFNELDRVRFERLEEMVKFQELPFKNEVTNLPFRTAFESKLSLLKHPKSASLLLLDQTGFSEIGATVFQQLTALNHADFLFFIASSTIYRFAENPIILKYFKLTREQFLNTPYYQVHRRLLEYYRTLIPSSKTFYLASFSLKKPSGVYGIIFGSGNIYGIEKFLGSCWKLDPERGEANFDIDDDRIQPGQASLFTGEVPRPKKVELFEEELQKKILSKELKNNKDVYLFTLESGFIPMHARSVIKRMKDNKIVAKGTFALNHKLCNGSAVLTPIELL